MQKSNVALMVMAVASTGVAAGFWYQLRAERALNTELSARLEAASAVPIATQPAVEPAAVAQPQSTAPTIAAAQPVAAAPPAPAATDPERLTREDWRARQRQLMSDPRYREAFREQERLRLATRRENFIRLLGFSPEQADAVISLSIDRQMQQYERNYSLKSAEDPTSVRERLAAEEREYQARLNEVLGAQKSAELQSYMETRQTRMQVDQFRTQLTGNDMLRDDQVEPLIAALHAEQTPVQKELQEYREGLGSQSDPVAAQRKFAERQIEAMKEAHQRMHSAAASILSSSQLEKLDAMLKRDLKRREAQQNMARIQSKLEPPAEAAGNSD